MILRKGNIQNSKGIKSIDDFSDEDKSRYENLIEQLKQAMSINDFAFLNVTETFVSSVGMGMPKKVELTQLSQDIINELNWLKEL
jgi:hypothetical protein